LRFLKEIAVLEVFNGNCNVGGFLKEIAMFEVFNGNCSVGGF